MSFRKIILYLAILSVCSLCFQEISAQTFTKRQITDHIYVVENPEGEDQLVIVSEKGLVVLNTFWSSITARKYKDEISRLFDREDFYAVINMVDRLDYFGGNAAYKEATIIGHKNIREKYEGKEEEVAAEIAQLIDMWRWKERVALERLKTHKPGSDEEKRDRNWAKTCKQRAEDLDKGFSLILPNVFYGDRKSLDLGDITLELIWWGRAGYDGMTVCRLPEEKTAIIDGFIMHSAHLTAHPHARYARLDVPRWIKVMEDLLEGDNAVERVVCDINNVWTRDRAHGRLVYVKSLWEDVKKAEAAGKSMGDVQTQFSLENEFAFVKEMQVYKDHGDEWVRPQHQSHVRVFYLQHKNLASEILKNETGNSLEEAIARIKKMQKKGDDIYFDEWSINDLGYKLINSERFKEAIEVLKLNAEIFPESANAYDSLAEAFMKSGDDANAIKFYRRSLEFNPENDNAKEMLKTLADR
jgi:hypothetical protein